MDRCKLDRVFGVACCCALGPVLIPKHGHVATWTLIALDVELVRSRHSEPYIVRSGGDIDIVGSNIGSPRVSEDKVDFAVFVTLLERNRRHRAHTADCNHCKEANCEPEDNHEASV